MSDKKIADMTYSEFCDYIDNTLEGDDRMDVVLGYDDFTIYEDLYHGGYYYLEGGENDASDFFEVELVARLIYSAEHDLNLLLPKREAGEIMHTLFDCDMCGERVLDDSIEYLWFKRKEQAMGEVQKSSSDYWDAINETSEDYVKALADFSEGQVVLEEETVAYIAKEITEFATGKLKEYGAKFPIVNKFYRKEQ